MVACFFFLLFNGYYMLLFVLRNENGGYSSVYIITPKRILLMLAATHIMLVPFFLFRNNCHLNVTKCYGILYGVLGKKFSALAVTSFFFTFCLTNLSSPILLFKHRGLMAIVIHGIARYLIISHNKVYKKIFFHLDQSVSEEFYEKYIFLRAHIQRLHNIFENLYINWRSNGKYHKC